MLENLLREHKLSVTRVRLEVLGVLQNAGNKALSSQDIEGQLAKIDRITLYRTIKSFENKGLIHQAVDNSGKAKYALCRQASSAKKHEHQHAHFHCTKCNNTICLEEVSIPPISIPQEYQLEDSQLLLTGLCADCKS